MGNEQPKKLTKATKTQIDVGALKAKIHLQLMRDRKNNQIIKGEKQLVNRIKAKSRNKTEEILIAERVVNGLKYAQACNQLMAYAVSIRSQANFISQNMFNPQKIQPWLPQIYSLIYAADLLGLSSLKQFKDLMKALNDPMAISAYVNPEILQLLKPNPIPEQLNVYMLEFSQRNNIPLQEINMAGHKFTKDFHPIIDPSIKDDSFADLEKRLADQLNKKANLGGNQGGNEGGNGGNNQPGWGGSQPGGSQPGGWGSNQGPGGFGNQGGQGSQNHGYYNLDKNKPVPQPSQFSNPYGIRESVDPRIANKVGEGGPKLYDNEVPSNPQKKLIEFTESRISIKSIDDIDYFPEIEPPAKTSQDVEFDKICEILKAAM